MQTIQRKISIERFEALPGASAGLPQKTARVRVRLDGDWQDWHALNPCPIAELCVLLPSSVGTRDDKAVTGSDHDWTAMYLDAADNASALARNIAALTIALQREAGVPINRARVVRETATRDSTTELHLAFPYDSAPLLKAALLWTLRLLYPDGADERHNLRARLQEWLAAVRRSSIAPELFHLAMAAHARALPVRTEDNDLVLGWGYRQTRLRSTSKAASASGSLKSSTASLPSDAASAAKAANAANETLNALYAQQSARIPTTAITGTNGKTTTARMLHHILGEAGWRCGVSTSQGIWVGREQITHRNLSGQPGGSFLLAHPAVEAAVLEMPRKGLISFGHPCDRYDVAALLNVEDDHIGTDGIETIAQMAHLKAEILARAQDAVVVNADDPLCIAMLRHAGTAQHLLVAHSENNDHVAQHRERGGSAVFVGGSGEERCIMLASGAATSPLMRLQEIPATMNGLLAFNESNALFATALAWALQVEPEMIRQALAGFHNSPQQNAGRFNFVEGFPFQILVDYAHNPAGMRGLLDVAARIKVSGKRVLVNSNGLRYRRHLEQELPGYVQVFDRIYIGPYEDYFLRSSRGFDSTDPIGDMLSQASAMLTPLLSAGQTLHTLRNHADALRTALESCEPGDLLVMLCEVEDADATIEAYRSRLASSLPSDS